jgi:GH15 family glucan-1,4-alpha-glucosidase
MGFIGDIIGGVAGAIAGHSAAGTLAKGAEKAQAVVKENQKSSIDTQNQEWEQQQANEQPFLQAGQKSVQTLSDLANNSNTFNYGKTFAAPTAEEEQNAPGFQFRLQQGTNALNQNAAANGTLMSGNTGKALQDYGQNLATTQYNSDYQNALNTYMTNYNVWNQGLQTELGTLQNLTNTGSTTAGQLGQEGQAMASNEANVNMNSAQMQAQQLNNAAAARAQGTMAIGNGIATAAGGAAGMAGNYFSGLPMVG